MSLYWPSQFIRTHASSGRRGSENVAAQAACTAAAALAGQPQVMQDGSIAAKACCKLAARAPSCRRLPPPPAAACLPSPRPCLVPIPPCSSPVLRLLATWTVAAGGLEEQLQRAPWLQLLQVPRQGRGLFAARDIERGEVVLAEAPMLAAPSPHALDSTCHQCLQPLPAGGGASRHAISSSAGSSSYGSGGSNGSRGGSSSYECGSSNGSRGGSSSQGIPMCSSSCADAASRSWARAAAAADLAPLQEACRSRGEKFPLMLARLACLRIQQQQRAEGKSVGSSSSGAAAAVQAPASVAGDAPMQGDPLTQLQHLCFANLPEVPQPWVELHRLLLQGLQPLCSGGGGGGGGGSGIRADWLDRTFSLQWFSDALSRLHLNSFR